MKILVLSCDKNVDTFQGFYHCMEKYYPNHPEVIYATETVVNPYYKTICKNYPVEKWTKRIRETLAEIDDEKILLMIDDCFIRRPVDIDRLNYVSENLTGNIAMFNFEKSFDKGDMSCEFEGFKKRRHGSSYEVSLMCGLWNKEKLINVLSFADTNPWQVEFSQPNCGYDYYINSGDFIIDWGYHTTGVWFGKRKGAWCQEAIDFFKSEGINI